MRVEKRSDGYWIVEIPESPDHGPYAHLRTQDGDGAEQDRVGLERFFRHESKPGFMTVDRRATR